MKRIYEIITKTNQVLLFFLLLGVAVMLAIALYRELTRHHYTPPQVTIAQTPEAAQAITVQDVRWLGNVSGVNFFGIVKKSVAPNTGDMGDMLLKQSSMVMREKAYYDDGQTVNIVISHDPAKPKTLLPSDGFVLSWQLAEFRHSNIKFRASVFQCVTEDTDGNRVLDAKDRNDLYIVPMDASKSTIIIKGVSHYDFISETKILIKTRDADRFHFAQLDIETLEKQELRWK